MFVLSAALIATGQHVLVQESALPRRADWAAVFATSDSAVIVRQVTPMAVATRAGLRIGDRVLTINGQPVDRPESFLRTQQRVRVGEKVRLLVRRGDVETTVDFEPIAVAPEEIPGVSMEYRSVRSPRGYRVATLVTRPSSTRSAKLPDVLNDVRPGSATLVFLPQTDHGLMRYASAKAAFSDDSPVHDGAAAAAILSWLRRRN